MKNTSGILLTVSLWLLAGPASAAPAIEVMTLEVGRANMEAMMRPAATTVEFRVTVPDARILGLSKDSVVTSWTDDTGADLLKPVELPDDDMGMGMGQMTTSVVNNIRHNRVSVGEDGNSILVTAVTPALPAKGAGALSLDGNLVLRVAGDGERTVTLENVSLEEDGFGRIRFDVDGKQLSCRLDAASGSGAERVSEYYCFAQGLRPLRFVERDSEGVDVPAGDTRPNLIVVGPIEDVTIDVVLPEPEDLEVPLDLDVGLGLGG